MTGHADHLSDKFWNSIRIAQNLKNCHRANVSLIAQEIIILDKL